MMRDTPCHVKVNSSDCCNGHLIDDLRERLLSYEANSASSFANDMLRQLEVARARVRELERLSEELVYRGELLLPPVPTSFHEKSTPIRRVNPSGINRSPVRFVGFVNALNLWVS
jgi:hypothetical protein